MKKIFVLLLATISLSVLYGNSSKKLDSLKFQCAYLIQYMPGNYLYGAEFDLMYNFSNKGQFGLTAAYENLQPDKVISLGLAVKNKIIKFKIKSNYGVTLDLKAKYGVSMSYCDCEEIPKYFLFGAGISLKKMYGSGIELGFGVNHYVLHKNNFNDDYSGPYIRLGFNL